ncbi:MAG: hypothetical protein AB9844_02420 [Clostridiaceae bacterium]
MAREINEWERYKEINNICDKVGCKQMDIDVCNPDIRKKLCFPKKELLNRLEIAEEELENNSITWKAVFEKLDK